MAGPVPSSCELGNGLSSSVKEANLFANLPIIIFSERAQLHGVSCNLQIINNLTREICVVICSKNKVPL
jgi:hypothetical protein